MYFLKTSFINFYPNRISLSKKLRILFYFYSIFGFSQNNQSTNNLDSLLQKDYSYIRKRYFQNKSDSILSKLYSNSYILKSKKESNYDKLIKGYEIISYLHRNKTGIKYTDSIIQIAQRFQNQNFFASGYLIKGNHFFFRRDFKKSLDNYIIAYDYAIKADNQKLIHSINHVIGLLKNRAGKYDEALVLFKKNYNFYSNLYHKNNFDLDPNYLAAVFALSNSYIKVNKLDSVSFYNQLGIKASLRIKSKEYTNIFRFNEGIYHYSKKNYAAAIDSLSIALPNFIKFDDRPNTAYTSSFLGKALYKEGSINKAIHYLEKVDELFDITNDLHPEIRDSYEILIDHYKNDGNREKQLQYVEKLLKVDSLLLVNYKYLWEKIDKGYDRSSLEKEKELIIISLEKENKFSKNIITLLSFLCLIAVGFWIINFKRKKIYKQRFINLVNENKSNISQKENVEIKSESMGFSEEIVNDIISHLDKFEKTDEFLKQEITISRLAEKFKTNSRYLSKVVNTYKKKNFNNYLNDLRINFAIEKLKNDKKYRNYTIKAIANEIGFKKAESFSKAFFKRTGIYPSFFIKQLNEMK